MDAGTCGNPAPKRRRVVRKLKGNEDEGTENRQSSGEESGNSSQLKGTEIHLETDN